VNNKKIKVQEQIYGFASQNQKLLLFLYRLLYLQTKYLYIYYKKNIYMSKKNYLLIDNGHGLKIIDITDFSIPLSSLIENPIHDEKGLMEWLYKQHKQEVFRIFASIHTYHRRGTVQARFGHAVDKDRKKFILNHKLAIGTEIYWK
jgi:hypothetical protein